jgi:hypothetical protein
MAERLRKLADEVKPMENRFLSDLRAAALGKILTAPMPPERELTLRFDYGNELLQAGRPEEGLKQFDAVARLVKQTGIAVSRENMLDLERNRALCHLRRAEIINCQTNHNADSCLLPLHGGGVHVWRDGSLAAVDVLNNLLAKFPGDLAGRWLLNIAFMTLGEYPDKVPPQWLIPPKVFESDYDIGRFRDVAIPAGLAVNELSGGSVVEDFDGDGFLDVMTSSIGLRDPLRLFHNNGDGTFTERTTEAGLTGLTGGLNLVHADFDNDGWPDVFVLRGAWMQEGGRFPNSLLRNRRDGTFEDVTEAAGLLSSHPTQTAVWFDFDGDGWLDLFIGNETSRAQTPHPCELYRNNGNGTFTEMAAAAGVAVQGYVKGVAAGDFNNDGRPDIYISILNRPNLLLRNDGPADPTKGAAGGWRFSNVSVAAGITLPRYSFPCWFFDYDNDGWEDIFVSGYKIGNVGDIAADYLDMPTRGERARLYHNQGDGTFADVTKEAGLSHVLQTMGCNFGDLDNDGWPDFYLGTGDPDFMTIVPNRMFRNADGKHFQDVTTSGGFGNLQKGHGVSFADLDNDGDQDVFENMGGAFTGDTYPNVLYENPGHGNHWIKIKLEGVKANRAGLGARLKIHARGPEGERIIHHTVSTGGSFGSNPLRQEIGLGKSTGVISLEIKWPGSGTVQTLGPLEVDAAYAIREGTPNASRIALKTFRFPKNAPAGGHHHDHTDGTAK